MKMDVLVKWDDGTENVVSRCDLVCINDDDSFVVGCKVKMSWCGKWYKGVVLDTEEDGRSDFSSSDEVPLKKRFKTRTAEETNTERELEENTSSDISISCDSDVDPPYTNKCEVKKCHRDAHSLCHHCEIAVCVIHFDKETEQCKRHGKKFYRKRKHQKGNLRNKLQTDVSIEEDREERKALQTETVASAEEEREEPRAVQCETVNSEELGRKELTAVLPETETPEEQGRKESILVQPERQTTEEEEEGREVPIAVRETMNSEEQERSEPRVQPETVNLEEGREKPNPTQPEHFVVEGEGREVPRVKCKRAETHSEVKKKRDMGLEYTSLKTKNVVPARVMRKSCVGDQCAKYGRKCADVNEAARTIIFKDYYNLGDLQLQREFIVRHVDTKETKQKTTNKDTSRRQKTNNYYVTVEGSRIHVCKMFFLNTLGISERTARTALNKLTASGVVEKEKRGGRQSENVISRDKRIREAIENHISRFPRVESHYCRSSTSKEYLHSDLTIQKMYSMFISDIGDEEDKPSISTYHKIFNKLNLAFYRPKKDQCSLCMTYREGDVATKEKLQDRYQKHIAEKTKVREIKDLCKQSAKRDPTLLCATFDLQQVLHLPISKESAVFYKRRLANYNLTFYNIANKDCFCYTWHEGESRRGASEISTVVYKALTHYDNLGCKSAVLFSDGCSAQNKNSIVASMLLYTVQKSVNINEISLRYFESFHGQSEGDSCHSTISTAVSQSGDIFVPTQLIPIFRLARRKQPYIVSQLEHSDFLDFKKLSQNLRILNIRKASGTGESVNWKDMMEIKVSKEEPNTIFYKTSHNESTYKAITLKRLTSNLNTTIPGQLNPNKININPEKYADLMSLCAGDIPVIRHQVYKLFYEQLPH